MQMVHTSSYQCYYTSCQKTFATKFNLRRHVNASHLAIKTYGCETCQKKFASKQNLREHSYIHTGEKPFICPVDGCGRQFRQASQLCVHKKCHEKFGCVSFVPATFPQVKLTDLLALAPPSTYKLPSYAAVYLPPLFESRIEEDSKLPVIPSLINQMV